MLAKIEVLDKPAEVRSDMHLQPGPPASISGNDVLTVEHLAKTFDRNTLFSDLSFDVKARRARRDHRRQRNRKDDDFKTYQRAAWNRTPEPSDSAVKVQIGYYDQEHHVLHPDKTLFEEISDEYPNP